MKYSIYSIFIVMLFTAGLAQAEPSAWDKSTETYAGPKNITVYRDPGCGCCKAWIEHLNKHGFNVIDKMTRDMSSIKKQYGVQKNMASCHTAIIDGYVIEGHVPADDIKKLLNTKPDIAGLSVPQMPVGTPGMEMGNKKDPFVVMELKKTGQPDSFNEYLSY